MAEYIDRQKVLDLTKTFALDIDWVEDPMYLEFSYVATNVIKNIPAADVRPVVLAAWQSWEQDKPPCKWYSCDYCGFHALSKSNFCPNCGAMMEES